MAVEQWLAYLTASLVLILIPGPDAFLVAGWSAAKGFRAGFLATAGTVSGILVHTAFATIGLSTLLANSAMAFTIVKFIGAIYLVYIGIKTIKGGLAAPSESDVPERRSNPFLQSWLCNVMNPKVALFFLAFLPQFVDPSKAFGSQFFMMGLAFAGLTGMCYILLTLMAGKLGKSLGQSSVMQAVAGTLGGVMLIGFGLRLALASNR